MSEAEQCDRMRLMRDVVRTRNVFRWAGQMRLDISQPISAKKSYRWLRKSRRIRSSKVVSGWMSGNGPTLPTWALQQVGSYPGYTGRDANIVAKA